MTTYYGVVKGNIVVLPEGVELAEGATVEVRVLPQPDQLSTSEANFKQRLIEAGLLTPPKMTTTVVTPRNQIPVKVEGQPIFQTIIEERR